MDRELYHSKSMDTYICFDKDVLKDFLFAFRNYNLYGMILQGHNNSFQMWSHVINKEAEDLITNLDNQLGNIMKPATKAEMNATNYESILKRLIQIKNIITEEKTFLYWR